MCRWRSLASLCPVWKEGGWKELVRVLGQCWCSGGEWWYNGVGVVGFSILACVFYHYC